VVWGEVARAPEDLFRLGERDGFAQVIYGSSAAEDVPAERLKRACRRAKGLEGVTEAEPAFAAVARVLSAELAPHATVDLPDAIARGARLSLAAVVVHRRHLPEQKLVCSTVPLLRSEDGSEVAILPDEFWEPDLVQGWLDLGAPAQA
jgi:hypothetical protein